MNEPPLRRTIGLFDATMIGLGAIVGAGIFVATGVAAGIAGSLLPLAILLAAVPAFLNGISAAANAVALPKSGGAYYFARELLSPFFGFLAGWLFISATIVGDTAVALGFGAYLAAAVPVLPPRIAGLSLVILVTAVNVAGLALVTSVNNLITAVKVGVLVLFILVGAAALVGGSAVGSVSVAGDPAGVISAAALLFFAYPGFARVATLAEEVRNPSQIIPRSVVLALAIASVLYVFTALIAVQLVGSSALAASAAPLAVASGATGVSLLPTVVASGGVIATSSVVLLDLTAFSRIILAMSRNGDLPGWLGQVNPRSFTPTRAVLAAGGAVGVLVLFADLSALIAAASFALLAYYVLNDVSTLRLPESVRPFPAVVPFLGVISCLGLASFLPSATIVTGLLITGLGALAYTLRRGLFR
ncbi:MAG: APC family permease [Chloroflexota bacterium]